MKCMKLTTNNEPIPADIIALATDINNRIGGQDMTVIIHDEKTGREYKLEPNERRTEDATLHQKRMGARTVQRQMG